MIQTFKVLPGDISLSVKAGIARFEDERNAACKDKRATRKQRVEQKAAGIPTQTTDNPNYCDICGAGPFKRVSTHKSKTYRIYVSMNQS